MEPSVKLFVEFSNEHIPSNRCNCSKFKGSHQVVALLLINLIVTLSLRSSLSSILVRVLETLISQFFSNTASINLEKVSQPSYLASFTNLDNLAFALTVVL